MNWWFFLKCQVLSCFTSTCLLSKSKYRALISVRLNVLTGFIYLSVRKVRMCTCLCTVLDRLVLVVVGVKVANSVRCLYRMFRRRIKDWSTRGTAALGGHTAGRFWQMMMPRLHTMRMPSSNIISFLRCMSQIGKYCPAFVLRLGERHNGTGCVFCIRLLSYS